MGRARTAVTIGLLLFLLVMGMAMAWACSPQAGIFPTGPQSATAGARVPIEGSVSHPGLVEIRWNSLNGPIVGMTEVPVGGGSRFQAEVSIPDSPPGIYYLVLKASDGSAARAAFEVLGPSGLKATARSSAADLWSSFSRSRTAPEGAHASADSGQRVSMAIGVAMAAFATGAIFSTVAVLVRRRLLSRVPI